MTFGEYLQFNYQMQQNIYISTTKKNTDIPTYTFIHVYTFKSFANAWLP